jgi:nucleotidyltransferase/DNA polymerase involved in DNA repair
MFALVDCNNFYASCQRVFEPHLIGKPVVILSNNDGCVIARSNEAKALGIPMGAPAFEFKKLFEENNVFVYSSNYALYGDMSSRVMNLLTTFTPDIEIYSIDEAFKSNVKDYLNQIEKDTNYSKASMDAKNRFEELLVISKDQLQLLVERMRKD